MWTFQNEFIQKATDQESEFKMFNSIISECAFNLVSEGGYLLENSEEILFQEKMIQSGAAVNRRGSIRFFSVLSLNDYFEIQRRTIRVRIK
ncbi:hypothetical protein LEP1GSC058_3289 [Leptospira fainei serovar Hurstbridge str. BUT 6]|uniref:Uncharacterized protein n=1 Tax=Leptospira fainei serovar Hurstbridge str. BUT 6 TaxID=1193011 RepID=S3V178_9LEPT|nr:hypothetical protein LEP1GSC058_3289 [Leptospira fainei serovar Hurstbridge str. BUT 6]